MDEGGNKVEAVDSQQFLQKKLEVRIHSLKSRLPQSLIPICHFQIKFRYFLYIYQKVIESGKYNFEACRIPLKTNLNVEFFIFMLSDYEDNAVVEFLESGFPTGFTGKVQKCCGRVKSHKGATAYPAEVKKYLR